MAEICPTISARPMLDHPPLCVGLAKTRDADCFGTMTNKTIIMTKKLRVWKARRTFWSIGIHSDPKVLEIKSTRTIAKTNKVPCHAAGS